MRVRYLAPNLLTASSLVFGLVSLASAHGGDFRLAAWFIIYAVMTDRLDGLVARRLKATSELGVQLDSFADFLNFGVAPAFLLYSFLRSSPLLAGLDLPYHDGIGHAYLAGACILWVLAAVFRLARFNLAAEDNVPTRIYFGVPTTLAGGLLVIWFLAFLKYADPGASPFGGPKLLGDSITTPRGVWLVIPAAMLVGAYLMASSLKMLKSAKTQSRALKWFLGLSALSGYILGWLQLMPEYMLWMPTVWILVFLVWGRLAEEARALEPPPLFPPSPGAGG